MKQSLQWLMGFATAFPLCALSQQLTYEQRQHYPLGERCMTARALAASDPREAEKLRRTLAKCTEVVEIMKRERPARQIAPHETRMLDYVEISQVMVLCNFMRQRGATMPPVCGTPPFNVEQ